MTDSLQIDTNGNTNYTFYFQLMITGNNLLKF